MPILPYSKKTITAAAFAAAIIFFSPATVLGADEQSADTRPQYVSPSTIKSWQNEGIQVTFLDVREADEFEAGHLEGAVNIVYEKVSSLADELPHDQPIVLYCIHSAHRAQAAAKTLGELGFKNAYVMEGGIVAWQVEGFTIRATDLASMPKILPVTDRCTELIGQ